MDPMSLEEALALRKKGYIQIAIGIAMLIVGAIGVFFGLKLWER